MSSKVKELLSKGKYKEKRLVKAFPKANYISSKVKKSIDSAKNNINEKRKKNK